MVVHLGAAGRLTTTGPTVRAVATSADRVTFVCAPDAMPAARRLAGVHQVQTFDPSWVTQAAEASTGRELSGFVHRLRERSPHHALVLDAGEANPAPVAVALRMAGVVHIAATTTDDAPGLLDIRLRPADGPETTAHLALAVVAGYPLPPRTVGLSRSVPQRQRVAGEVRAPSAAA